MSLLRSAQNEYVLHWEILKKKSKLLYGKSTRHPEAFQTLWDAVRSAHGTFGRSDECLAHFCLA